MNKADRSQGKILMLIQKRDGINLELWPRGRRSLDDHRYVCWSIKQSS